MTVGARVERDEAAMSEVAARPISNLGERFLQSYLITHDQRCWQLPLLPIQAELLPTGCSQSTTATEFSASLDSSRWYR